MGELDLQLLPIRIAFSTRIQHRVSIRHYLALRWVLQLPLCISLFLLAYLVELHLPGQLLVLSHLLLAFNVPADDLLKNLFLLVNLVRGHGHAIALQHPQEVLGGQFSIGVHLFKQVLRQGR